MDTIAKRIFSKLLVFTMAVLMSVPAQTRPPPGRPAYSRPAEIYRPRVPTPETRTIPEAAREFHAGKFGTAGERDLFPSERTHAERAYWNRIKALGGATSDIAQAYVVLQTYLGDVYLTTNYVRPPSTVPQVITLKVADLGDAGKIEAAIKTLIGDAAIADSTILKVFLDKDVDSPEFQHIFNKDDQSLRINTSSFRHAELYVHGAELVFPLVRIDRPAPPPRWATRFNECCVRGGVPPDWVAWHKFGQIPFHRGDIQIVSLELNSKVKDMLGTLGTRHHIRSADELPSNPLAHILDLIHRGDPQSPVILVGHVVDRHFQIQSTGELLPFEAITQAARDANRPLFMLGCYTAEYFASHPEIRDYAGTTNRLYAEEVVPRLLNAIKNSSNMREFTENISEENVQIWISNNFLRSVHEGNAVTVRAPIYKPLLNKFKSIVGFLYMYIPCRLGGACS